jgi:hypothetical protein
MSEGSVGVGREGWCAVQSGTVGCGGVDNVWVASTSKYNSDVAQIKNGPEMAST